MSNLHGLPDVLRELQAIGGDLLPAVILSTTWPVVPASSLTLEAFATHGYVRDGTAPPALVYVAQPAAPVTVPSSNGLYWLALTRDTTTPLVGWARQPGTHYVVQAAASRPPDPPGGLVFAQVTVAGNVITALQTTFANPRNLLALGGPTGALAYDFRLVWDAPTQVLDIGGDVHVGNHLAVGTSIDPAISLRVGFGANILGGSYLDRLGVGVAAPPGVGDALIGNRLGVGTAIDPTVLLSVGTGGARVEGPTRLDRLGIGQAAPTTTGHLLVSQVGIGTAIDPSYSLTVGFGSKFSGGVEVNNDLTVYNRLSIGAAPQAGLSLYNGNAAASQFVGGLGLGNIPPGTDMLAVNGSARIYGGLGVGSAPTAGYTLALAYDRATQYGINIQPSADSGAGVAISFVNASGAGVGSITTTATATAYNTTSDARLKIDVAPLTGSLAVLRATRPVGFHWKGTAAYGEGFLAHELQRVPALAHAVTGEPDAVDAQGNIVPQQVDYSKLVPRLTGSVLELLARLEALEARPA